MPRYVARFEKGGYTKYISHLDLLRVFKRAFKVMGLDIRYSNGYNPHPKMSFAQPLSLGYSSLCEYLEFETLTPHDPESLKVNAAGIAVGVLAGFCYSLTTVIGTKAKEKNSRTVLRSGPAALSLIIRNY